MKRLKRIRSYSDYTLETLFSICGIDNTRINLEINAELIEPSPWLKICLENSKLVLLNTEKAKSEWLIVPVLTELSSSQSSKISYFFRQYF
jgi:hypothetical protein